MKRRQLDQLSATVLVVFSLIVYFVAIPAQVPEDRLGLSSSFFPKLSAVTIGLLGVMLFFRARVARDPSGEAVIFQMAREEIVRGSVIFCLMISYILLLHLIGYVIATPVILGLLLYYSGQRRWKILWPMIVLVSASIYVFFEYGMKIFLPRGTLF